ncbi:DUF5675 family protein [Myroides fluvii]|uniref:DUF5675 family protein n=1 Tax=Myroides fluvii TaxID=2572594 RepID=UPI00131CB2FD|nr:DUF5675 family protein [Myroides fluvii]
MNKLTLHRVYLSDATHGLLQFNDKNICFTLELPWLQNKAYISCIPEGTYPVQPRYTEHFKHHMAIKKVPNRHGILFHSANNVQLELQGCIAPVSRIISSTWGHRSKVALQRLLEHAGAIPTDQLLQLTIKEASEDEIINLIKRGKL